MSTLGQIYRRLRRYYLLYVVNDPFERVIDRWYSDHGDTTLRVDYPLSTDSVVFDVGGYIGDWTDAIATRYNPWVFVFEPVPSFAAGISARFSGNPKIRVFDFGLYDRNETDTIRVDGDKSGLFVASKNSIEIQLRDISDFVRAQDIRHIDLIKINIEGAEYRLLKRMIDQRIVELCTDIQVQFHSFYPESEKLREEIQLALSRTHQLTYEYPFVWENWRRR